MTSKNLFLFYRLNITSSQPVSNSIIGEIKYQINLEELSKSPLCYHNEGAFKYMLEKYGWSRNYATDSALQIFDCHVIDYTVELQGIACNIHILFFSLKHEELLIPEVINKDNSIKTLISRHIMIYNNIGSPIYHDYSIEQLCNELSKDRILDLRYNPLPFCKTKLYDYQRDNIQWMIEKENNPPWIDFPEQKLFDMGSKLGLYFNYDMSYKPDECFIPYNEIPKRQARGGIICDETGLGKTVQMLCLAFSKPDIKSLIIVPNHIKSHWDNQLTQHFVPNAGSNDILIVSYAGFAEMDLEIIKKYQRMIVDEIHETYSIPENNKIYIKLQECDHFTYRWGISATPFTNTNAMNNLAKFIVGIKRCNSPFIGNFIMLQQSIKQVFRKNLKANVSAELSLPEVAINNMLLNFNQYEQDIYNAEMNATQNRDINFLRQLCCNVLISVCNEIKNVISPRELKRLTLNRFLECIQKEQHELDKLIEMRCNVENTLVNIENPTKQILLEYEQRIQHINNSIKVQQQIIARRTTVYESYKKMTDDIDTIIQKQLTQDTTASNIVENMQVEENMQAEEDMDENKLCPICYAPFSKNIALFIACRHYFCSECFERCHKERPNQCPMCRTVAEVGEINFISNNEIQFTSTKNSEILRLINTSGERFIIFTQFPKLIKSITQLLSSNNINALQYPDFASASREEQDNTQIIVLSSNANASGIDLSFIHNVIIMEPFENYVYGKEIEKQIIGRVHRINQVCNVNVYRLIIRDTIEETIYSMN